MKPFAPNFFGRHQEGEWLKKALSLSRFAFIHGFPGAGKKSLVRHFSHCENLNFSWITCQNGSSLSEIFKGPHLSPSDAFDKWSSNEKSDIWVFESVQNLKEDERKLFIKILSNSKYAARAILISDEDLRHEFQTICPTLHLKGLDEASLRELVLATNPSADSAFIAELNQQTQGLPQLVQLYLLSPTQNQHFFEDQFKTLSTAAQSLMKFLSVSEDEVSTTELASFFQKLDISAVVLECRKKHLIEESLVLKNYIKVPPYVSKKLSQTLNPIELEQIKATLAEFIRKFPKHFSPLSSFIKLSFTKDPLIVSGFEQVFNLQNLGTLSVQQLETVVHACERFLSLKLSSAVEYSLLTLKMRALFFAGKREEALLCFSLKDHLKTAQEACIELQIFCLEWIFCCNRMGRQELLTAVLLDCKKIISDNSLKLYFDLEFFLAHYLYRDAARLTALRNFDAELQKFPKDTFHVYWDRSFERLRGEVTFQIARCFKMGENSIEQAHYYKHAQQFFTQAQQEYYALSCELNLCWIAIESGDWQWLQEQSTSLMSKLKNSSYPYFQAGLNVILARQSRYFLDFHKALQYALDASKLLPKGASKNALLDVYSEIISISLAIGQRRRAQAALMHLKSQFQGKADPQVVDQLQKLEQTIKNDGPSKEAGFELHPFGRLALLEEQIKNSVAGTESSIFFLINQFQAELDHSQDSHPIKIALSLVKSHFATAEDEKKSWQDQASLDLARWAGDADVKAPLELWLAASRHGESILASPKVRRLNHLDTQRWTPWWNLCTYAPSKAEGLKFQVFDSEQQQHTVDAGDVAKFQNNFSGLFVSEITGEVSWNGKFIEELKSRHSLRRFLIALMESGFESIDKESITELVWSENYHPMIHDPRIYTSVVRLRQLLPQTKIIDTSDEGYRISPQVKWKLVRMPSGQRRQPGLDNEIMQAMKALHDQGKSWCGRSDLEKCVNSSPAQIKRQLRHLLDTKQIQRLGQGRKTQYSLHMPEAQAQVS